jgi:hypothetical protein
MRPATQGVGAYSAMDYRNGSDIDSDNYNPASNYNYRNGMDVDSDNYNPASNYNYRNGMDVESDRVSELNYRNGSDIASDGYRAPPTHTVKSGQTLSSITGRNDPAYLDKFAQYNGLASRHDVKAGQVLQRPDDATLSGVVVSSAVAKRGAAGGVYYANRQAEQTALAAQAAAQAATGGATGSWSAGASGSWEEGVGSISASPGLLTNLANIGGAYVNGRVGLGDALSMSGGQIKGWARNTFLEPIPALVDAREAGLNVLRPALVDSYAASIDPNGSFLSRWANQMTAGQLAYTVGVAGQAPTTGLELTLTAAGAVPAVSGLYGEFKAVRSTVTATYSGDVFAANFMGPRKFEVFYRGDETLRSEFLSSMAQRDGIQKADSFLAGLNDESTRISLINHSYSSEGSALISTTQNRRVAEYFARGENQSQQGFVTEFRVPAGNQADVFKYNEFSEFNMRPNPKIGLTEQEYVVPGRIDTRYIHDQYQVSPR